jgi:hypothetical protein
MIFACDKLEMCEIELRRGGVRSFVRRQMVDTIDSLLCGGEVGVDFQAIHVADDQQWWVDILKVRCHPRWPFSLVVSRVVLHILRMGGPRLPGL